MSIGQSAISLRTVSEICLVSSAEATRSARPKALRAIDLSTHAGVGWTHAPRPGSAPDGSGTTSPSRATTLNKEDLSVRTRQPRQVLTGSIVAPSSFAGVGRHNSQQNLQLSSETLGVVGTPKLSRFFSTARGNPNRRRKAQEAERRKLRSREGLSFVNP